jgi:hypothetical protein
MSVFTNQPTVHVYVGRIEIVLMGIKRKENAKTIILTAEYVLKHKIFLTHKSSNFQIQF